MIELYLAIAAVMVAGAYSGARGEEFRLPRRRRRQGRSAWGRLLDRLDPGPTTTSITGRLIRIARARTLPDADAPEPLPAPSIGDGLKAISKPETFAGAKREFKLGAVQLKVAVQDAIVDRLKVELQQTTIAGLERRVAQAEGKAKHLEGLLARERAEGRQFVEDVKRAADSDSRQVAILQAHIADLERERDKIASEAWRRRCQLKDLGADVADLH